MRGGTGVDPPIPLLEPEPEVHGSMSQPIDITSQRFGRLVAIRRVDNDSRGLAMWSCQCDCGNEKSIRGRDLREGKTQSCGCWQNESRKYHTLRHGNSRRNCSTPEYASWANMLTRCRNPNCSTFKYYGGRGIKVCKRWLQFENFIADMGHRPSPKHRLDRINVNNNYTPTNCRWANLKEHQQNKRPRSKVGTIDKFTTAELEAELSRRYAVLSTKV